MIEIILSLGAVAFLARGIHQGLRRAPKASTWFAGASALLVGLSVRFPGSFEATAAVLAAALISVSAAGTLFIRERIGRAEDREIAESSDVADLKKLREAAGGDKEHG